MAEDQVPTLFDEAHELPRDPTPHAPRELPPSVCPVCGEVRAGGLEEQAHAQIAEAICTLGTVRTAFWERWAA